MQKNISSKINNIRESLKNYKLYILIVPLIIIVILASILLALPEDTLGAVEVVRSFLTNEFGVFYLLYGLAFIIIAFVFAFSKIGKIRLGKPDDKPLSNFSWGALIFTSTMAADILYYALHEWSTYYTIAESLGESPVDWATRYPLFHWGVTPWIFYLVPAVCYAFMFYVRKRRSSQRISEACRPLLGRMTDKAPGAIIDIVAILGLLLGTSTTFSVATPLITAAICELAGVAQTNWMTVIVLVAVALVYTAGVIGGFKSIDIISKIAVIITSIMLALFFVLGGPRFILESGVEGIGSMFQNFLDMSTWTDPSRYSGGFPQDYTVFYWSYWIAWAVATPLFIAKISKGKTIKQLVLGGLLAGLLGTFTSFIILGGTGLGMQVSGELDIASLVNSGASPSQIIIQIISQLPLSEFILVLLIVSMILLYATTFDTISHTMASYMTKSIDLNKEPTKGAKLLWSIIFIILPIALIFSDTTTQGLTAMSIIGALPLAIIFILVVISFFRDYKRYRLEMRLIQSIVKSAYLNEIDKRFKNDSSSEEGGVESHVQKE